MKRLISILLALMCLTAGIASAESVGMPPNVVIAGTVQISIPVDEVDVKVYLENPFENVGWYNLVYELWAALPVNQVAEGVETKLVTVNDDEGNVINETLYAKLFVSDYIAPGNILTSVKLTQPVPKGNYEAFLDVQPYYIENGVPTSNNVRLHITLIAR